MVTYRENYIVRLRRLKNGGITDSYYTGHGDKTSIYKKDAFNYDLKWFAAQVAKQFLERNEDYISYHIEKDKLERK